MEVTGWSLNWISRECSLKGLQKLKVLNIHCICQGLVVTKSQNKRNLKLLEVWLKNVLTDTKKYHDKSQYIRKFEIELFVDTCNLTRPVTSRRLYRYGYPRPPSPWGNRVASLWFWIIKFANIPLYLSSPCHSIRVGFAESIFTSLIRICALNPSKSRH